MELTAQAIYDRLLAHFGPQGWWPLPALDERARPHWYAPFEVAIGAILVQHTAWRTVEPVLDRLRADGLLQPDRLRAIAVEKLAPLLRPAGPMLAKARTIHGLTDAIAAGGGLDAFLGLPEPELRARLLAVRGIGPETADCVVLYGAGYPRFVIDAYTRRILTRLGFPCERMPYGELQAWFEGQLPPDAALFNEYHALLVILARDVCRPRPRCAVCPLRGVCEVGRTGG